MAAVESGMSTPQVGAQSIARNLSQSVGCSMEQIFSPINIYKGQNADTPGFRKPSPMPDGSNGMFEDHYGPTINQLNPYFTNLFGDDGSRFISECDYNIVVNEGTAIPEDERDFNLRNLTKAQRQSINKIRTQGLRTPLILSGWGFDLTDAPVPFDPNDKKKFDPEMIDNRSFWKTGPLHVMWDDERQVWSGCHQTLYGKLITAIEPNKDFKIKVFRKEFEYDLNEEIECKNKDNNLYVDKPDEESGDPEVPVVVMRLNYEWIPVYIGASSSATFLGDFSVEWSVGQTIDVTRVKPAKSSNEEEDQTDRVVNLFADVAPGPCIYVKIVDTYYLIAAKCIE